MKHQTTANDHFYQAIDAGNNVQSYLEQTKSHTTTRDESGGNESKDFKVSNRESKSAAPEDGKPKRRKTKWDQPAKLSNSRGTPPPQPKQTKPDQSVYRHVRSPAKNTSRHGKTSRFDQSAKTDSHGHEKKTSQSRNSKPSNAQSRSPVKDKDISTADERGQSRNERERNRDRRRDRDWERKQDSNRDRHGQRDRRSRDRDRDRRSRERDRDRRGRSNRESDYNRREVTRRDDGRRRDSNPVTLASR